MSEKPTRPPSATVIEFTLVAISYDVGNHKLTPMNSFTPEEWKLERPVWASSPFLVSLPLRIRNGGRS